MRRPLKLLQGQHAGLVWGLLWGVASCLVVFALWSEPPFSDPLRRMEQVLYDLRMKQRILPVSEVGSRVVVVGINADDERRFGRLPWSRKRHAELVRHLAQSGAKAIVLDILFPDATEPDADEALASAIQEAGIVFLPEFSLGVRSTAEMRPDGVYRGGRLARNHPLIRKHAAGTGHINVLVDDDSIVRRVPARIGTPDEKEEELPLGFAAALRALGAAATAIEVSMRSLKAGPLEVPLDEHACIPVNYLDFDREVYIRPPFAPSWVEAEGRKKPIMVCSYQEAMGLAPERGGDVAPVDFRDTVVVVAGTIQESEADIHITPFGRQHGALIHAAFIHSLLQRQFVRIPGQRVLFLVLLAFCVPLGAAAFCIRLRGSSYVTIAGMVITLVGILSALGLLSWAAYNYGGLMLQITPLALALLLHFGAALAANLSRAARETEQTRKGAEEALRESEAYLKSVLDSVRAGIVVVDPQARQILDANLFAAEMLGAPREQLVGRSCHDAICPAPAGACPICDLNRPVDTSEARLPGGSDGPIVVLKTAALVERKGRRYVIESFIDITNRKQVEEELRESNRRLRETLDELAATQKQIVQQERLRALGEMASGIAHDFNNALMPVVGYTDMLLASPEVLNDTEKVQRYLQNVRTAAEDAQGVVKRLREFYRRREEDETLLPIDLNQVIRVVLTLTQPRWKEQPQARGATIAVETDLQPLPATLGNETELREMLTNLVFNAVDALPNGGTIVVRTRTDGSEIVLQVADDGLGMTEEVRRRCLEPFFTTKGERGTGLGLAVAYGIIHRHQGTIEIESEIGKGSTFSIRLPVRTQREEAVAEPVRSAPVRPLRVLVVDDDPEALRVMTAYLEADGHAAATATNGAEALEKFRGGRFDLVVTDMAMPGMSGEQLAAKVREMAPDTRVIMLSGFAPTLQDRPEGAPGVDLVLGKPVTLNTFRQALERVVALMPPAPH
jgi:PAS domain S-box-containing protein